MGHGKTFAQSGHSPQLLPIKPRRISPQAQLPLVSSSESSALQPEGRLSLGITTMRFRPGIWKDCTEAAEAPACPAACCGATSDVEPSPTSEPEVGVSVAAAGPPWLPLTTVLTALRYLAEAVPFGNEPWTVGIAVMSAASPVG